MKVLVVEDELKVASFIKREISKILFSSVSLGVFFRLFIGKSLGIFSFAWITTKIKLTQLPININFIQILELDFLGGIGFTMSIFISLLAFDNYELQSLAKFQ